MSLQDNIFFQRSFLFIVFVVLLLATVFSIGLSSILESASGGYDSVIINNLIVGVYNSIDLLFYFYISVLVLSLILAFFVYYSPIMFFLTFFLYIVGVFISIIYKYVFDTFFSSGIFDSVIVHAPLLSFLLEHYIEVNVFWLSALIFFMYVSPLKLFGRGGYY